MPVDAGLLIINKPAGVTSFWVVSQVRRILGAKRVGHCGTLDPMATGVLIILFGAATRRQEEFMGLPKTYRAAIRLGMVTDTGDITGTVTATADPGEIDQGRISAVLGRFIGNILQVPPMYSALKKDGRRLYEIARAGGTVPRAPRPVTIYRLDLVRCAVPILEIDVCCSRGTYVRTLAEDIGAALGCGGTLERLCRARVGAYGVERAVDGARLPVLSADELYAHVIPLSGPSRKAAAEGRAKHWWSGMFDLFKGIRVWNTPR